MVESVIWHLKHLSQNDYQYHMITDHTGFTLNDLVSYDGKHNERNGETITMDRTTTIVGTAARRGRRERKEFSGSGSSRCEMLSFFF